MLWSSIMARCFSWKGPTRRVMHLFTEILRWQIRLGAMPAGSITRWRVLADTGCYADFTLPTAAFHPAQIAR